MSRGGGRLHGILLDAAACYSRIWISNPTHVRRGPLGMGLIHNSLILLISKYHHYCWNLYGLVIKYHIMLGIDVQINLVQIEFGYD